MLVSAGEEGLAGPRVGRGLRAAVFYMSSSVWSAWASSSSHTSSRDPRPCHLGLKEPATLSRPGGGTAASESGVSGVSGSVAAPLPTEQPGADTHRPRRLVWRAATLRSGHYQHAVPPHEVLGAKIVE